MALKPIVTTCVPREDVVAGNLPDNAFAAQLDKVVRDPAGYPVYGDADKFFAITFPTSGLKLLLNKVFARVAGRGETGVIRSETSFGGGKTHGLTAVYHLAKGARPDDLARFIDPDLLPEGPVQIAAIVGDAMDPVNGVVTQGRTSFTVWGEMGAQIGAAAFETLQASDVSRTAPGAETIKAAFGGQPTIVIIDEIAHILRQAAQSGSEDVRRYARQIPAFLTALLAVAGDPSNRVAVVVTLASTRNAYGKETDDISELLDERNEAARESLAESADVLQRMVQASSVIKPSEDAEIGEILKARLFESIDEDAAKEAAVAYRELYEALKSEGEALEGGAGQPTNYAHLVEKSYPFHPELVRVLDKRLGTISQFQRARGSLKLVAEVIAGIWADQADTDIINVADIDFAIEPVLNHLTSGLSRPEFAQVAAVDLVGPASHAASVDARAFPGKPPFATRVDRTVFVHSLEQSVTGGAGRAEWIMGTLRPGESVAVLETALAESERVCWHLSSDGARWRFHTEPNVTAILEDEKANVQNTRVAQVLDDRVKKAFGNDAGITTVFYPSGPAGVPDEAKLRLVVIDPDQRTVSGHDADSPDLLLVDILDHKGQDGTPRMFRNSVVFVVADVDQVPNLQDKVRTAIAADTIAGDPQRLAQFSDDVRKKIKAFQDAAQLDLRIAVTRCFKHLYFPTGDRSRNHLHHRELPAQQQGDTRSGTAVVATVLADESKIKDGEVSYDWVQAKAWPDSQDTVSTKQLSDWFWRDHSSPIFRTVDPVRKAITDGIRSGGWVYHDAATGKVYTGTTMAGLNVEFRDDAELMMLKTAEDNGLLVRKPTVNDLKGAVTGSKVATGAQVRALLETKCGGEPTKAEVAEALAAAVSQHAYEWLVVLDQPPAPGVRALTPSDIKDKGLDSLRIVTREAADQAGVEIPGRVVKRTKFTATGASGSALATVLDQVADSGSPLMLLRVQTTADETVGIADITLLTSSLGMVQGHETSVEADLTAEFAEVQGAVEFSGTADRKAFQTLNGTLSKVWQAATSVAGTLTVTLLFADPLPPDAREIAQLRTVFKTLNITNSTVVAEVVK